MENKSQIILNSGRKVLIKAVQISESLTTPYLIGDNPSPNPTTILNTFKSPDGWPVKCLLDTDSRYRVRNILPKYVVAIWLESIPTSNNPIFNESNELVLIFNTNNVANMSLSKQIIGRVDGVL